MGICQENIRIVDTLKVQHNLKRIIHFYLKRICVRIRTILQNPEAEY